MNKRIAGLRDSLRRSQSKQGGFTLIEILVAVVLMGIVLTLSAGALRHFWLLRSLNAGGDDLISQMRSTQEKVVSESFPLVYGVRFDVGTKDWYAVRFDPLNAGAGDDTCTITETNGFSSGVEIKAASFTPDDYITEFCRTATSAPATAAFVFFYPRGYATPGSVELEQTVLGKTKEIGVAALTGRVEEQ